jgi:hypothetical protein
MTLSMFERTAFRGVTVGEAITDPNAMSDH